MDANVPSPRVGSWLRLALLVGALVMVAAGASAAVTCAYHMMHPPETTTNTTVIRSTPDVVVAIRDLARLESTSFHVERIIDVTDKQERLFGLVTSEDAILLVAAGDVSAGVDLTRMHPGDVMVDPETSTARIVLPAPQVLSTRLDNKRTYVYSRRTDTLAKRHEDLETRARSEAESTLEKSAIDGGILDRAKQNAAHTVETLVRSLGYAHVIITWRTE